MTEESVSTMHLDKPGAREAVCAACGSTFAAKRKWARFCGPQCRNAYHASMTPQALRRDIDELKHELAQLRADAGL